VLAPGLGRAQSSSASSNFEWTLDACVSRQLSPRQLEPLIALEGQTVQLSLPGAAARHTQIHISCADADGRRLVVTTQVTEELATRTIDLQDTSDELRPRVVALAATELLRRLTAPTPRPAAPPRAEAPPSRPGNPPAPAALVPSAPPPSDAGASSAPRARSWLTQRTTRDIGYTLLGTSTVLTIVALVFATHVLADRTSASFNGGDDAWQHTTELAIGLAAATTLAGLGTMGYYGFAASRTAAERAPPTRAQLRLGYTALGLTALGVAALVPATVTVGLAAHSSLPPERSAHTGTLYYSAAGLYAGAAVTLAAAAAVASAWWGRRQPALRVSLRPSTSGGSISLSGRF
jgi:hypothetical protein